MSAGRGSDRAVSEVLAFVLVFSLIISSVGLLYAVGFDGVENLREGQQTASGQQAFEAVAVAFDDIQRDRGIARAAPIELSDRSISVDGSSSIAVEVVDTSGTTETVATSSGTLIYGAGRDSQVAYEAGAVVRSDGPDSELLAREPRIRCQPDRDRAVVSLVTIDPDSDDFSGAQSRSGSITLNAVLDQDAERTRYHTRSNASVDTLTIDYSGSPYETAWERHFQEQDEWSAGGGTADCDLSSGDPPSIVVRVTEIDLSTG